jgi:hypothetical protein
LDLTKFWTGVNKTKKEFQAGGGYCHYEWLAVNYGISLEFDPETGFTGYYEIVDKKKFVVFLLKFT